MSTNPSEWQWSSAAQLILLSPAVGLGAAGFFALGLSARVFARPADYAPSSASATELGLFFAVLGGICLLTAPFLAWLLIRPSLTVLLCSGTALLVACLSVLRTTWAETAEGIAWFDRCALRTAWFVPTYLVTLLITLGVAGLRALIHRLVGAHRRQ